MYLHLDQLFYDNRLMLVCLLNMFINLLTLTTNAARVSGAETKRVATALSLFNVFQVSFRTLNLIYAPLMASIVDILARQKAFDLILIKLRFVVLSAAFGSFLGLLLLPTFINIYKLGIKAMERYGSIPRIAVNFIRTPSFWVKAIKCFRKPSLLGVNPMELKNIPKTFLVFNMLGVSMWTIGVISSTYASVLNEKLVRTSIHLSGIVNGIGTIFLFVLVEPVSALIVDQVISGDRPEKEVRIMVIWLAIGSIIGNLLGAVLLVPSAHYILWISKLIGG
ncbi:MAG: lipid II flippase family protein [Vulcanimicrobiota bacterium]